MTENLYIGLMSGTSMDGVDCALVQINGNRVQVIDFLCRELPSNLKRDLLEISANRITDLRKIGSSDVAVARLFAKSVFEILQKNNIQSHEVAAIGSHGQTIWHEPQQSADHLPFTLQIGDPNTIALTTGITTVADFRRKDMAAGGQGAPMVPAFHAEIFRSSSADRFIINLGGIANITFLPKDETKAMGLDTGPASVLMDAWIRQHLKREFDDEGKWARSGRINNKLLNELLNESYFNLPPPKSTGRELFNIEWLNGKLSKIDGEIAKEDVQATLLQFSVETIKREILKIRPSGEIIVCGGGVHNQALLGSLKESLDKFAITTSAEHGINPDCVESVAFAWFASKTLKREAIDFTPFTGARQPVIAGGVYYSH
jgi:anhydro-N-acetylmuramic acid kinase